MITLKFGIFIIHAQSDNSFYREEQKEYSNVYNI